jgi:hypothetical protein
MRLHFIAMAIIFTLGPSSSLANSCLDLFQRTSEQETNNQKFRNLLGTQVSTSIGVGTVLGINTPFNGLYYEPSRTDVLVDYRADKFALQASSEAELVKSNSVGAQPTLPKRLVELSAHYLRKVSTAEGVGILVGINIPSNGLYSEPARTVITVWFGFQTGNKWISKEYHFTEVYPANQ